MSNLRPAPIFLTPQVVRGALGVGHAKRMVELPVTPKPAENSQKSGGVNR